MLKYDDLLERLQRLDEDAALTSTDSTERYHLIIVGGGALILLEYLNRATHDIDALDVSRQLYDLLEKYDINCRVSAFINNFPYNYLNRVEPLPITGGKIDFYTASLEDIVIAKLYSHRDPDMHDIESEGVLQALDWGLLEHLATNKHEARASALSDRGYQEFLESYRKYTEKYRPCDR
jgi:hypothetical protein